MEKFFTALIVAVVQGITEWLPVSSSGHLVLTQRLLGYGGGLVFDVALHFGTLMAVFVYFGKDITDILQDLLRGDFKSENGQLGLLLILATLPAALAGFLLRDFLEVVFDSLVVAALGFGITGLVLFISSFDYGKGKGLKDMTFYDSLVIGASQIFSLIPGISRSGMTISSGLLRNLSEESALKFSFLMSIPIIFGANILAIGDETLPPELIWATLVSFVVGLGAIHVLYKYVLNSKKNLRWFGGYALLLSLVLGIYFLFVQ